MRKKALSSTQKRRRLLALGLLFALVGLIVLFKLPQLKIQTVIVENCRLSDPKLVYPTAESMKGRNILWVKLIASPASKLVAVNPKLASCHVSVVLPKTLILTLTEKKPWITLVDEGGHWYQFSEDGSLLRDGDGTPPTTRDEPLVLGVPKRFYPKHVLSPNALSNINKLVARLHFHFPHAFFEIHFDVFSFDPKTQFLSKITVFQDHLPIPMNLGNMESMDLKLRTLNQFLSAYMTLHSLKPEDLPKRLDHVDVSLGQKIIVGEKMHTFERVVTENSHGQ
ncbi:MAG: cell division protein FtsQ/DivIB [Candidatus Margulisiibacteriota bacterium]